MNAHAACAGAVLSGVGLYDGQAIIDHCCVPRQAPQHKATSGDADPSVCKINVGFYLTTLALEPNITDTNHKANKQTKSKNHKPK